MPLQVSKTSRPSGGTAAVGQQVTYTITATNRDDANVSTSLTDNPESGMRSACCSSGQRLPKISGGEASRGGRSPLTRCEACESEEAPVLLRSRVALLTLAGVTLAPLGLAGPAEAASPASMAFTAPGVSSFTVPANVTSIAVSVTGGGGAPSNRRPAGRPATRSARAWRAPSTSSPTDTACATADTADSRKPTCSTYSPLSP